MCGITGIISKNKLNKKVIEAMTKTLIHRGPDGFGYYYGKNFIFGHRRLSIIDISEAGHQPMEYIDRYVITYNGEIYNYIEIKNELEANGYEFKSHTDTEVIMASYDAWGVKCLDKFNGMWAFVIYDKQEDKYFMSRDRFGKKPFYYYKNEDTFIFSSEIKAILTHPEVKTSPNITFLEDYVKYGCKEYTKETAFENIYRFDFSSYFEGKFEDIINSFVQIKFWRLKPNLSNENFDEEKLKEYAKKYYELLEDAVRIRLRADVKVGSALSGGLDSSSIVYLVNKLLKEQGKEDLQETFSSVYKSAETKYCDESEFIDKVANYLNVHSNQIEPKEKDVPREHSKMIWYVENPPEGTCMSGWYTFKLVSQTDVKVTLDGQGADEQLGGYLSYLINYMVSLDIFNMIKETKYWFKIPNASKYVNIGIIIGLFRKIFGDIFTKKIIKFFFKRDFEFNLNQKLANDINTKLITLIHYSDHISMAHSIESRMPFMDYRLVEFLASVPACYKMRNGWTKYIARVAFDGKLPDEITWRRDKMGWPIPENYWFKGNLKEWFIQKVESSSLVKELALNLNIKQELDKNTNIVKLIRYLNIVEFENLFLEK
ncbi:asparagine synthase (glutamine-hydrolyzing) [Campylobacter blaseri]|uniref:asparagine synthase (glutamine-hydrolyzing) n=1 Tax=Campylobacter blaseri TaxID=2042961 RepID=A0A2P8R273_9BACT|nr:asparagine synthase (glutamine-hydrolyzing) [Campylobacter blaseri]PSM52606.1 asparagine synthase (glutamine-hydrolyzing) [Campylobacter blaseri]PSM54254.1 asparagine synthase (glutamine-hydrolyzing) [Campylobacter blaseri]QKF85905.1 asparagine synthase (glutamine-hydrolyzing) [Campylobacter blaseri]